MKKMNFVILAWSVWLGAMVFALFGSMTVWAYDWMLEGHVTVVEASYLPGMVTFQMDTGTESCPSGSWLVWDAGYHPDMVGNGKGANVKGVYAGLLSTKAAGGEVVFFGLNDGCKGEYINFK